MELTFDKCMECGRTFSGYAGLSKHLPKRHPDISIKEYYDKYYKQPGEGICPVCGKETQFSGRLNRGYYTHCSQKCTAMDKKVDAKRRATKKELYGSETFNNHDKTSKTKQERYGDANYANGDQIRATKLAKYGMAGYNNSEQAKKTKLERYGDETYVNTEKAEQTKLGKYGDAHFNNSGKALLTKLAKYGIATYVNHEKASKTVKNNTIMKYNSALNDQCEILDYTNRIFHCRCKKCGNTFDIPIGTGFYRLFKFGINWCTVCQPAEPSRSKEESSLYDFVKSTVGDDEVIQSSRNVIGKELDIYVPKKHLAIEFDGLYWHDERRKDWNYHLDKTTQCDNVGVHLIHVFEDEWNFKKDIVKSRIAGLLGFNHTIYARKCIVREITYHESAMFLDANHIQGTCVSKWRYALQYNGEIVAVMTFGRSRFSSNGVELLRYCSKCGINVVGGAGKLFKYFVTSNSDIVSVVSYADRRWSNASAFYQKLGFTLSGVTQPAYYYVINGYRHNRLEFTKQRLVSDGYDPNMTEHDIMLSRKIYRIYDCGNYKYMWHR